MQKFFAVLFDAAYNFFLVLTKKTGGATSKYRGSAGLFCTSPPQNLPAGRKNAQHTETEKAYSRKVAVDYVPDVWGGPATKSKVVAAALVVLNRIFAARKQELCVVQARRHWMVDSRRWTIIGMAKECWMCKRSLSAWNRRGTVKQRVAPTAFGVTLFMRV